MNIVPSTEIEEIVGVSRNETLHYARAVSSEQTVYILHPYSCLSKNSNLLNCAYSVALCDYGIDVETWPEDVPVVVGIDGGMLCPIV